MATHNKLPTNSFIDQQGWEQTDQNFNMNNTQISFLKNVQNHNKQHIAPQRRTSRYQELYKEKLKLARNEKQSSEAVQLPQIYPQNQQFLTIKTIDLTQNTKRSKYKWNQSTKEYFRTNLPGMKSLQAHQGRHSLKQKDSSRHYINERNNRIQNSTKRLYFQYKEHQKIDDLTARHLTHYLRQKNYSNFKTGQRIFQIPFRNSFHA